MTEPATDIDAYLADVPEAHRQALQQLRVEIRKAVPEATEAISYKIPTLKYRGRGAAVLRIAQRSLQPLSGHRCDARGRWR